MELEEKDGITNLSINGSKIHQIIDYKISKRGPGFTELNITILVNTKKSNIKINTPVAGTTDVKIELDETEISRW